MRAIREATAGALVATAGALVATAIALALRAALGPSLPSFIPAEESARPGMLLGMTAGYGEEVLFRMVLMPLLYFPLRRRLGDGVSASAASVVATGFAFAPIHAAGERADRGGGPQRLANRASFTHDSRSLCARQPARRALRTAGTCPPQ